MRPIRPLRKDAHALDDQVFQEVSRVFLVIDLTPYLLEAATLRMTVGSFL
jgi:hypothetical protein